MGLYSFMFQTVHAHTFAKSHTLLAPPQWNQCSQFSSRCTASHSAKGFLWSNTTSCSATSDTDANTVQLLYSGVAVHSQFVHSRYRMPFLMGVFIMFSFLEEHFYHFLMVAVFFSYWCFVFLITSRLFALRYNIPVPCLFKIKSTHCKVMYYATQIDIVKPGILSKMKQNNIFENIF